MPNPLTEDIRRCAGTLRGRVRELLLTPSLWAVVGYRFRHWVAGRSGLPRPIRAVLNIAAALCQVWTEVLTNIELPATARIGPGLLLPHTGYIVIDSRAVIGRHCTVTHGVTLGHAGGGPRSAPGSPVVGDRVYIGPGAILLGPITIGDDALIGAGAVVTRSVPPRAVVAGNPARVLSFWGAFDLISYTDMERDPDRIRALGLRDAAPVLNENIRERRIDEEVTRNVALTAGGRLSLPTP